MAISSIARQRLINQQISQSDHTQPAELVAWFGAMQAQDYLAARWAVGLRLSQSTDAVIEQAIADKSIVRTWALRGTIHLIAAADIHWMLPLLKPRLRQLVAPQHRKLAIDEAVLAQSQDVMARVLTGGEQLTRPELKLALEQAGIRTDDLRLNLLLGWASFEGLICFGCRRGNEFTHTLLDEWAPSHKLLTRDEALAELATRYFRSHGPATIADFVWWSGLTVSDAKAGLDLIKSSLLRETADGYYYWMSSLANHLTATPSDVYFLPSFDEYLVGYKDRRAALGELDFSQIVSAGNGIFKSVIVADGQVVGTWKRTFKKDRVMVDVTLLVSLNQAQQEAIIVEAERYGAFLELNAQVVSETESA
jgi:hypothetical protein